MPTYELRNTGASVGDQFLFKIYRRRWFGRSEMGEVALTILEDAHRRCGTEDMRTAEVFAAVHDLEARRPLGSERWPFEQFRRALGSLEQPFTVDHAGRGQIVNAALNGIRRVCQIETPRC